MSNAPIRLLIAASGTGGHLFPAIAVAEQLRDYQIDWLGVPDRLETTLVPKEYPLHTIAVTGFQKGFGLSTLLIFQRLIFSVLKVRSLLKKQKINAVFTTGGYISGPAIVAARLAGIPVIIHDSNAIPGKVTRWLGPLCDHVALGFADAASFLGRSRTVWVSTPVRENFHTSQKLDLPIPKSVPLIVVVGGSQGAVALNHMVRQCAPMWFKTGAMVVHLTGKQDPDADSLKHPQYISLPFYDNMAALFQRANLAISRAGAGTLTELAVTKTPSILIPYPYAAEDHQAYNAKVFAKAEAAYVYRQATLTPQDLSDRVLSLLESPEKLEEMSEKAGTLAVTDSAEKLAHLLRSLVRS